jgi:hypothetical protein
MNYVAGDPYYGVVSASASRRMWGKITTLLECAVYLLRIS